MELTINVFWIILLIVIIHTILHHLINWGFRMAVRHSEGSPVGGMLIALVIETVIVVACLDVVLP